MNKTIEERANEYMEQIYVEGNEIYESELRTAFCDGAESEHKELTRWNSPDNPPKDRRLILIKVNVFDEGILYYVDRGFENADDILEPKDKIIGWREINE